MAWQIEKAPEWISSAGRDAESWVVRLHDPETDRRRNLVVQVSGSALASRRLAAETADVITTGGTAAADVFSEWLLPPRRVLFTTNSVAAVGGIPPIGPVESADVAAVAAWFDRMGVELALREHFGRWEAFVLRHDSEEGEPVAAGQTPLEASIRAQARFGGPIESAAG